MMQFDGFSLMVQAYAGLWIILMVWIGLLWRRQSRVLTRVTELETALVAHAAKSNEGRS